MDVPNNDGTVGCSSQSRTDFDSTDVTTVPTRLGGLGYRSAARPGPRALWTDALSMLQDGLPTATEEILAQLTNHRDASAS